MRHSILILVLAHIVLFTGCDTFRRLAGRPTSAEIEAKREAIMARREAEHQAHLDSLRKVEKQIADSLAVIDSLRTMNVNVMNPQEKGGLSATRLEHKYYVIVGSFVDRGNAEALCGTAEKNGYPALMIDFRNGFTAVGVCPADSIVTAYDSLKKVREEAFCPEGVWILVN